MEDLKESSTFDEAYENDEWRKAMGEEIRALKQNQTWELLGDVKTISCKWVYTIKTWPNGSIERYKAQLVAQRYCNNMD